MPVRDAHPPGCIGDIMPKAKKKPVPAQPVAPTPPPAPEPVHAPPSANPNNLPVLYDRLEIDEYSTTSEKGPLNPQWCKDALGWETEKEYQARSVKEQGGKPGHYLFGDLGIKHASGAVSPIHCKNVAGEKVVAKFNAQNRPFDDDWCEALTHTR